MEVAVGAALIKRGISVRDAFRAAAKFAHTGTDVRQCGVPFPDGATLLCVDGDRSTILHIPEGGSVEDVKRSLMDAEGFYILYANLVFDRAVSALGWHPEAVLDAAYSKQGS
jgi:hypothetical protein